MLQREAHLLEVLYQETVENYLRVAPIRSGDSVIIKEVAEQILLDMRSTAESPASRVEPREK